MVDEIVLLVQVNTFFLQSRYFFFFAGISTLVGNNLPTPGNKRITLILRKRCAQVVLGLVEGGTS